MPASNRDDAQEGVTAVVGTVLVLAITVTGIGVALFLGTPVIQRLQDEAAVDTVVGSFEAVRHASSALTVVNTSRSTPLPLPAGVVSLGPGSHFLVTLHNTTCDVSIQGWADWGQVTADRFIITAPAACTPTSTVTPCPPPSTCVHVLNLTTRTPVAGAVTTPSGVTTWTAAAGPLRADHDYVVTIEDSSAVVSAHAWLLHTDRLSWSRTSAAGEVAAHLEAGMLFAREYGALYRVAGPRIDEGNGTGLAVSLPTFQNSSFGGSLGEGDRGFYQVLVARDLLNATTIAHRVRIEVHGDLAEAWCNTFLQRNGLVPLTQGTYAPANPPPAPACGADADGVRGVVFSRTGTPFPFQFGQPILHARLQV